MRLENALMLMAEQVRMLYSAETLLTLALPRVALRAQSPQLRRTVESHLEETRGHAARLERVAKTLGFSCGGGCSHAMVGLLKEGEEALGYGGPPELVDQAIIAASRRIEHYEMSSYKSLLQFARTMPATTGEVAELITATLREEEKADKTLDEMAGSVRATQ